MTEDDVKAFIKWLADRNLDICNSSHLGRVGPLTFWPVGDTDHLARAYAAHVEVQLASAVPPAIRNFP